MGRTEVRRQSWIGTTGLFALALSTLTACEDGNFTNPLAGMGGGSADGSSTRPGQQVKVVERDVEAPDVFQVTENGLWDGRPSLGGVWVAHPDVKDPERVIIRNTTNEKFVIGALFRRERESPGPRLQVSSDAAAELGMLAGKPVELNVTALRREEVAEEPEPAPMPETLDTLEAPDGVSESTLDPVEAAPADDVAVVAGTVDDIAPAAAPTPRAPSSSLKKPYIQIGIFSVKANADNTAQQMRSAGMVPIVREQSSSGKKFWRVIVGPASNTAERTALLQKIKATGFSDAYAVTN